MNEVKFIPRLSLHYYSDELRYVKITVVCVLRRRRPAEILLIAHTSLILVCLEHSYFLSKHRIKSCCQCCVAFVVVQRTVFTGKWLHRTLQTQFLVRLIRARIIRAFSATFITKSTSVHARVNVTLHVIDFHVHNGTVVAARTRAPRFWLHLAMFQSLADSITMLQSIACNGRLFPMPTTETAEPTQQYDHDEHANNSSRNTRANDTADVSQICACLHAATRN